MVDSGLPTGGNQMTLVELITKYLPDNSRLKPLQGQPCLPGVLSSRPASLAPPSMTPAVTLAADIGYDPELEERAAILEFDGRHSRKEAEKKAAEPKAAPPCSSL